jgi:hypothetical protein
MSAPPAHTLWHAALFDRIEEKASPCGDGLVFPLREAP